MHARIFKTLCLGAMCSLAAIGQNPEGYLDVYIAKVRPEKRTQFDAINKKMADLNRRNKGDYWLAAESMYGEMNTIYFTSQRQNYADVEKGFDAFMGALAKAGRHGGGCPDIAGFQQHHHQLPVGAAAPAI